MRRRNFLAGTGAALLSLSAPALRRAHAQGTGEIVFNGAGGSWQESARRAWLQPFSKATGVKVVDVFPFDIGKLSTMVRTGNVEWDMTDIPAAQLGVAIERGLLEPIDYSLVDRNSLPPEDYGEYHVVYGHFSSNLVFNTARVPAANGPGNWADYWDLKKFPGPRSFRRDPSVAFEAALLADGVAPDQLYPLDVERAFKKLEQLKPNLRWWTSAAQSIQLIADGEVNLGVTFNSRATTAMSQGVPLEVVWNQGLLADDYFVVPKGAKHKDNAMRLINAIIQPDAQARMANFNKSAPASPNATPKINTAILKDLPTAPQNRRGMVRLNELGYWAKHHTALQKRFDAWLLT